jgi:hypothetical protein
MRASALGSVASAMKRAFHALVVCGLVLPTAAAVDASSATQPEAVSVHVQRHLSVRETVHIGFHPAQRLPEGGYYYAVVVLKPYGRYTRRDPPPCSTSSNMERTDYGYPQPDGSVRLALTPTRSATRHWCGHGSYLGAVYAVPHAPPCERKYPCRSEPYKLPSPCWETEPGRRVCGVVALRGRYAYPGGIPAPLAADTHIVGRFGVVFR